MSEKEIRRISDLPYYKEEHFQVLQEMGIENLDDLLDALHDDERSEEIVAALNGVGPKIRDQWIELIEDHGILEGEAEGGEEESPAEPESELEEVQEETVEILEEEEEEEETSEVVEEGGYFAAPKPQLDEETSQLLAIRRSKKGKTPKFRRQEWFRYQKLGTKWRRPKGLHSKMRKGVKYRPPCASIGFRKPAKVRGLHSSGFEEIMVYNPSHLEDLDPERQAARVGGTVGYKKRLEIEKRANELGIHILNRMG